MSKEKKIEEMARAMCCFSEELACSDCSNYCFFKDYAERVYNAGYRKQSEGEWVDKPTGAYGRWQSWCSACGKHSGIGGIESNRHKPFCPNCGARMKGKSNEN